MACETYSNQEKTTFEKQILKYSKNHKIQLTKSPSGLFYKVTKHGSGPRIQLTDSINVSYELGDINEKKIQSLTKPMFFSLRGTNDVISGWKEALIDKRVGDELLVIIPPQLGYGRYELTDIPENSILVYKLNVVDIK